MIAGALVGLSLVVAAAVEPYQPPLDPDAARIQMPLQQKNAVIQPLMRLATDCIVQAVSGHAAFAPGMPAGALNDLIVSAMESCVEPMRAMIEAHDRLFGDGSGEDFFMGPYLEILPRAVTRQVQGHPSP